MYSNLKILETIITEAFFSLGLLSLWGGYSKWKD